ncbi:MAG: Fur family transcriptional regulator [Verrucomicrobiia bacterium]|jgi:Fur family ferric uptake transcriptional regulator
MPRHKHVAPDTAELSAAIRDGHRRLTGPRRAILDVLGAHAHPLTNRQIREALPKDQQCDLATIYRSMRLLLELHLVDRFDFGDGVARFELAGHHSQDHHHHLICSRCEDVVEVEECFPAELQQELARHTGFTQVSHKLEFFGICPDCAGKGKSSKRTRKPKPCGC